MSMKVEVVAADREVWKGEATQISARTTEGEVGILSGHAPLLAVLVDGEVRIDPVEGERATIHIDGGFLSVDSDVVTLVAEEVDAESLTQRAAAAQSA